jgi:hypothetical protein
LQPEVVAKLRQLVGSRRTTCRAVRQRDETPVAQTKRACRKYSVITRSVPEVIPSVTVVIPSVTVVIPSETVVIPSETVVIPSDARDLLFAVVDHRARSST